MTSRPKAYEPEDGYKYQLFCRSNTREWEHCDYAVDRAGRKHLLENYRQAYGAGFQFKSVILPKKYWPSRRCTDKEIE